MGLLTGQSRTGTRALFIITSMLLVLLTPTILYPAEGHGRGVGVTWSRTYLAGDIRTIEETPEGGFVVGGYGPGGANVMKLNSAGQLEWARAYTPQGYASGSTGATSVRNTFDHGYILSGGALSVDFDAWLLKLNHKGQVQWSRTYVGPEGQAFTSVEQTRDGGYIVTGNNNAASQFASNGWVMKLSSDGDVEWQHVFVGSEVSSVDETLDGGFVLAGSVAVDVGVAFRGAPWVFKVDSKGSMVWQKAYAFAPGPDYHRGHFVRQMPDGGYVMVGEHVVRVFPSGQHISSESLVFRLDSEGDVQWQKSFGGGGHTQTYSVEVTSDGSVVVAGRFLRRVSGEGLTGPFLLKLDSSGSIVWQKIYGGMNDFFFKVHETRGGGLVVVGRLSSSYPDTWLLKLDGEGSLKSCALGFHSNATIADTYATVTSTAEAGTGTDVPVTPTQVRVGIPQGILTQTLCHAHGTRKDSDGVDSSLSLSWNSTTPLTRI